MSEVIHIKDLSPLRGELIFVLTKDVATFADKHGVENSDYEDSAIFFEKAGDDREMDFYIVVNSGGPVVLRDILHEITHFKNAVMKYFGVKHDMDNDEWEAYFVEYYTAWCMSKAKPKLYKDLGFINE